MMILSERLWRAALVALVVLGCTLALAAPAIGGSDAGSPAATDGAQPPATPADGMAGPDGPASPAAGSGPPTAPEAGVPGGAQPAPEAPDGSSPAAAAGNGGTAATAPENSSPSALLDPDSPPGADALWADAGRLVAAVRAGNWREAVALALLLVFGAVLRFGRKIPGLRNAWTNAGTDEEPDWKLDDGWGTVLAFATSVAGAIAVSLLGDGPIDFAMFRAAFWVALGAVGMHRLWRKALKPAAEWAWLKVAG